MSATPDASPLAVERAWAQPGHGRRSIGEDRFGTGLAERGLERYRGPRGWRWRGLAIGDPTEQPRPVLLKRKAVPVTTAIERYLDEKRSIGAITSYTSAHERGLLYAFAHVAPDDAGTITRQHIVRWMKTNAHLAANTRRLYHVRVRGFTRWLLGQGVLRKDPFDGIPAPKVPRPVHRSLEVDQVAALLAACITPRDTMMIVIGMHTGLRRAELAALEVGDISLTARTLLVRKGKGGGQRLLPLSDEAVLVVRRYIAALGLTSGPLLRSEAHPELGIGPSTVNRVFSEVATRAGVKLRAGDGVAPHSMRHTIATTVYEGTSDVLAVSDLLGHSSLANTQRYVRGMNVERLRGAVAGLTYIPGPSAAEVVSGIPDTGPRAAADGSGS